jgi:hypothetical protein
MFLSPTKILTNKLSVDEIKLPSISKIDLSEVNLSELKRVLNSNRIASYSKEIRQRQIIGICSDCGSIPD